jgi:hypothetical protein
MISHNLLLYAYPNKMKEGKMHIDELPIILDNFKSSVEKLINRDITYQISERIDAAKFPDEYESKIAKIGQNRKGMYVFSSKIDGRILYVGISEDVVNRFWQHIGTSISWERNGNKASFPNCEIVAGRHWLKDQVVAICKSASFYVTFILPDPVEIRGLFETYLVFYGAIHNDKPDINVAF